MAEPKIELKTGEEHEVAYLYLPEHRRGAGSVATHVRLRDILPGYSGAEIYLDLDEKRQLVGIEILL